MQEINIEIRTTIGEIVANIDDVKAILDEQLSDYKNLVFTAESKPQAKKDLAYLRKLRKSYNDQRIAAKKEYMAPFEVVEAKCKELDEIVDEAIDNINSQVKAFEEKEKEEKREQIKEIYAEVFSLHPEIKLETLYNPKWDNASYTMKAVREDIEEIKSKVDEDLKILKSMNSEDEAKAVEIYAERLLLSDAMAHIQQYEAQKKQILASVETDKSTDEEIIEESTQERTEELTGALTYVIECDAFQKVQLESFMEENGIKYREV